VTHTHGPSGSHSHGGVAGTTWLDPTLAIAQAHAVTDAFVAARPGDEARFRANLGTLEAELGELDRRRAHAAAALDGRPVIFSHPVYQYLERRYGLRGRSVHWEPGDVPDAAAWRQLDEMRAEHPAAIMIWEDEPVAETLRRLAERGILVVVLRPSGNRPPGRDFLAEMRLGTERLEQAARPTTPAGGRATGG
jgi:zinc transport system substrate-binding protein